MPTATQADINVTDSWADLVASNAALSLVNVMIQNKSASFEPVFIVFGGANPGTGSYKGIRLDSNDSVSGNAAAIWARAPNGGAGDDKVSVSLL